MGDYLQLALKTENERKKMIYFLLAVVLSIVISCKVYARYIGAFEIVPLTEYKRIVLDFFLTGRFVVCVLIMITTFKLFYSLTEFIIYKWLAKQSDKLYYFFKNKFKGEIIDKIPTSQTLRWLAEKLIKNFKQLSVIEVEENKIKPGLNFYRLLVYFRKLNDPNDNEGIDPALAYFPIPITLQIVLLFDSVVVDHFVFSTWLIVLFNVISTAVLIIQFIIYFLNVFIDLKHDKILNFLEQLNKDSETT
jgi:hypothetical protein